VPEAADYPCAAVPRHFIRPYWGFLGKITAASEMKIKPRKNSKPAPPLGSFNPQKFLDTAGISRKVMEYRRKESIYSQGDSAETVMYVQKGGVKLSVVSGSGKEEAVVAMFGPGGFSAKAAWPARRCAWAPPPPRRRQRCW
jgi:Cyclic nucleotide-binding domain